MIVNGGDLNGSITIENDMAGDFLVGGETEAGATITIGGDIPLAARLETREVSGSISISGSVSGDIQVVGDLLSGGVVEIEGQVTNTGRILLDDIGSHSDGTVSIGDDLSGDIFIAGEVSGVINVADDLESGGSIQITDGLKDSGNITIGGLNSGSIVVEQQMTDTSVIKAIGGLGSGGLIDVNAQGDSWTKTEGTIWIGGRTIDLPFTIPFDGSVKINCGANPGSFTGLVKVVGCAATSSETADICINNDGGTVDFVDSGCTYSFATSCVSGCP